MNVKLPLKVSVWGECITKFQGYPGWNLPSQIEQVGFQIVPLESKVEAAFLALEDSAKVRKRIVKSIPKSKRILISLEPKAVTPRQYSAAIRKKYLATFVQSKLQTYGDPSVEVFTAGLLPNHSRIVEDLNRAEASGRLLGAFGVINQNKFNFSYQARYKMRRKLVEGIASRGGNVHLAGPNWERNSLWYLSQQTKALIWLIFFQKSFPNLRHFQMPLRKFASLQLHGRVPDEIAFLREYEFALVVENDPDYVSEKLFNAIRAGAVPIYVGPPLSYFGIDSAVAIENFSTPDEIVRFCESISGTAKAAEIVKAGRKWILDPLNVSQWQHDAGFERILDRSYELLSR